MCILENRLITACGNGNIDDVRLWIERGANIHEEDEYALRKASENGHVDIVRLLIDKGANVNAYQYSALCYACQSGHINVVRLLIENGANIQTDQYCALSSADANGYNSRDWFVVLLNKSKSGPDGYASVNDWLRSSGYQVEHTPDNKLIVHWSQGDSVAFIYDDIC